MNKQNTIVVAVDGPSASGKSTVSRRTAAAVGWIYVDSGALYRGVTWKCYLIDGEDPGMEIRGEAVRARVADIAAQQPVRVFIVDKLRQMTKFGNLVMEGRDIGTVVFPDSPFKYYLDADPAERARRRHAELAQREGNSDVSKVLDALKARDQKDSNRATSPLQIALGAKIINSTGMTIEQVVDTIVGDLKEAGVV